MNFDDLLKVESQNTDIQQLKGTDFEKLKRRIKGICILNILRKVMQKLLL